MHVDFSQSIIYPQTPPEEPWTRALAFKSKCEREGREA